MSKTVLYGLVMFSLLFFVACGGGAPSTDTPTNPAPTEPENPEDPESPTEEPTDPEQPTDPTPPPTTTNNSVILTGPTIGSGEVSNDQLRKEIGLTLDTPNRDFELGQAYAVAETVRGKSSAVYWIVPVTNVSDRLRCFINLVDIIYRDADGTTLSTDSLAFVAGGNMTQSDRGRYDDTCLNAGEQGYFFDIDTTATFNSVASLQVRTIEGRESDDTISETRVIPQSYDIRQVVGSLQGMDITIKSEGPATVEFIGTSTTILLDADNTPLLWDSSTRNRDNGWDGVLEPDQTNLMYEQFDYEGETNRAFVSLEWSSPRTRSTQAEAQIAQLAQQGLISKHQLQEQLLDARNARIEADLQQLEQSATE